MNTDQSDEFSPGRLQQAFLDLQRRQYSGVVGVLAGGRQEAYSAFGAAAHAGVPPSALQVDLLSVTKTITAVMVLKLVEDRRLGLGDTLDAFFDRVPADKAGITVRQLLTHSAGLREGFGRDHEAVSRAAFLQRALDSRLLFPPGESYAYSNAGYSLLAAIIETRADKPYEAFLRGDLLPRNGDPAIGYSSVFESRHSLRAGGGQDVAEASWGHDRPFWNLIGNGGLVSTAHAMLAFCSRFAAGGIVSAETVGEMQAPHVREAPDDTHYGYGLVVEDSQDYGRIYWHNGGSAHFSSNWSHYADHGLIVFAASATEAPDADAAQGIVARALIGP